ncbi:hypothetical protein NJH77_20895 [Serratia fonticola]|uniref:hypothetical protein n=1 Tax=Serratia fonticola TaxID=47917 RepID=UPI002097DC48|nr:hypothetical protein [Serratia fonticola]MCO7511711.1 hypothetical protein [Serratia fonticola]
MNLRVIIISSLLLGFNLPAFGALQCGGFKLDISADGWTSVNGERVTSQKITFLDKKDDWDNIQTDMGLMPARDGNMYGFQYINRDGKKWLNVQLLRASMNAPRIIGTFDCIKIKD